MKFRFRAGIKLPPCRHGEGFTLNAFKRARNKETKPSPSRKLSSPLRHDPTRTASLRKAAEREIGVRFAALKTDIIRLIEEEDALSLNEEPISNVGRWSALDERAKVKAFKEWIRGQARTRVLSDWELMWKKYGEQANVKGMARAFDDTKAPAKALLKGDALKVFEGTRTEFLRTNINKPEFGQRLQALGARVQNDAEGVIDNLSAVTTRLLADGLNKKQTPRQIAKTLSSAVDAIGKARAQTIARTEIVRAHAEGQLDALEALGITQVGVQVEWRGNPSTMCSLCTPLAGIVIKPSEARGMIPRHPNCMCAWIPANTGESTSSQKRNKGRIDKAISRSQKEEGSTEWGPSTPISRKRPTRNEQELSSLDTPILLTPAMLEFDRLLAENAFCPTGKGGGINPTCSPKKKGGGKAPAGLPYSITKDRPHLTDAEKKEYNVLFKRQQALHKKIKGGTASDAEKAESVATKARLNELSKVAQARAKGGGSAGGGSLGGTAVSTATATATAKKADPPADPHTLKKTPDHEKGIYSRDEVKKIVDRHDDGVLHISPLAKFLDKNAIDDGNVAIHGMTNQEHMREITIDGLRILWPKDGSISNLNLAYSVSEAMSRDMHPALWQSNKSIVFTKQRNMNDSYWETAYNIPNFRSAATGGDGSICSYNPEVSRGLFAHESGHNLAKKEWGSTAPDDYSNYRLAQLKEKPVSEYGSKSPAEDFAEACNLYVTRESSFKTDFPLKHAALKEILDKHAPPPPIPASTGAPDA